MNIFYLSPITESIALLTGEEANHCYKVLRKSVGDEIYGMDGQGCFYRCEITGVAKQEVTLQVLEKIPEWGEKKQGKVILAASPLRQKDRFEWLMEKAVELGADEIIPIGCKHTITDNIKPERLKSILISAAKQCKRSRIPLVRMLSPFSLLASKLPTDCLTMMGWCEAKTPIQQLQAEIQQAHTVCLVIGPEGDFAPAEVEMAQKAHWQIVSLGESRLRTETAGMYALSVVKMMRGF